MVSALLSSCHKDSLKPDSSLRLMANLQFMSSAEQLQSYHQNQGQSLVIDKETHTASVAINNDTITTLTYYFDLDGKYRFAMLELKDFALVQDLKNKALKNGFKAVKLGYTHGADFHEEALLNSANNVRLRLYTAASPIQATPAILIEPNDETIFAWSRTQPLASNEINMWLPLVAYGAPKLLIDRYEQGMGHSVNAERTNASKQFYAYNTNDARYPLIGYWLDEASGQFLSESAIYVTPEQRGTPQQLFSYLTQFGFEDFHLTDQYGNPNLYHKAMKAVAAIDYMEVQGKPFAPRVQFYQEDLSDQLPYEQVDFPKLNFDFGKISEADAFAWYEQQGYKKGLEPNYQIDAIFVNSPYFSHIYIWGEKGVYAGITVCAVSPRVLAGNPVKDFLTGLGFSLVKTSPIPTYHNTAINVECQVDATGAFTEGIPSMNFNLIGA